MGLIGNMHHCYYSKAFDEVVTKAQVLWDADLIYRKVYVKSFNGEWTDAGKVVLKNNLAIVTGLPIEFLN